MRGRSRKGAAPAALSIVAQTLRQIRHGERHLAATGRLDDTGVYETAPVLLRIIRLSSLYGWLSFLSYFFLSFLLVKQLGRSSDALAPRISSQAILPKNSLSSLKNFLTL